MSEKTTQYVLPALYVPGLMLICWTYNPEYCGLVSYPYDIVYTIVVKTDSVNEQYKIYMYMCTYVYTHRDTHKHTEVNEHGTVREKQKRLNLERQGQVSTLWPGKF